MKTIANYSVSMDYLKKYEQKAKKKFGQNFIIDPNVVKTIAKHSGTGPFVLEIGPGLGALTQQLAAHYDKVLAVEIDGTMVEILEESLAELPQITVHHQDFLEMDLSNLPWPLAVCANLPYYITTPILMRLMTLDVTNMTLMVQKEISDRLCAVPKTKAYSSLSIFMQYYYDIKTVMKVSRQSFHPQPNVDSIVIQLTPREHTMPYDETAFFEFVRGCFVQRRKTLLNNLKAMNPELNYADAYQRAGIALDIRADHLEMKDFMALYGALYDAS